MLKYIARSLWVSALLLVGLVVLLALILGEWPGGIPTLTALKTGEPAIQTLPSEERLDKWFSVPSVVRLAPGTNFIDPFYTLYFQPPAPAPTKRVELFYAGSFVSSSGSSLAYVRVDNNLLVLTNGAKVVADHSIKTIALRTLVLTNRAGQTNLLEFDKPKGLDVPAF